MNTRTALNHIAIVVLLTLLGSAAVAQSGATLTADKGDYAPGEVATLTGTGFL